MKFVLVGCLCASSVDVVSALADDAHRQRLFRPDRSDSLHQITVDSAGTPGSSMSTSTLGEHVTGEIAMSEIDEKPLTFDVPVDAQSTDDVSSGTKTNGTSLQEQLSHLSTEMQEILDVHNKYRCMHGVPQMSWDDEIAVNAQAWVDQGQWGHSSDQSRQLNGEQLGENIAWGSPQYSGKDATEAWYDEIEFTEPRGSHTRSSAHPDAVIGHYTQVVWKASTRLGCAKGRRNGKSGDYWVCQYGPAGNWVGQEAENVLIPTQSEAQCEADATSGGADPSSGGSAATTPSPTPAPASNTDLTSEMEMVLDMHNMYRCMHGVPAMTWDVDLAANAKKLVDQKELKFSPWPNMVNGVLVGESLALGIPSLTGKRTVELWYGNIASTSPTGSPSTLNAYTQLVWKASTKLGCAKARIPFSGSEGDFWACQYSSAGNMGGQEHSNVFVQTKTEAQCGGIPVHH